jgi:hypothetical protein
MKKENLAVLLLAKQAIQTKVKSKPVCDSHTKQERVVIAATTDGHADWVRFKRECVLLKGGKSK